MLLNSNVRIYIKAYKSSHLHLDVISCISLGLFPPEESSAHLRILWRFLAICNPPVTKHLLLRDNNRKRIVLWKVYRHGEGSALGSSELQLLVLQIKRIAACNTCIIHHGISVRTASWRKVHIVTAGSQQFALKLLLCSL